MIQQLGAIPLSPDILEKGNIGLWAFELDEGCPPRMYVDTPMLSLLGLQHQIPPEETYHAWYDYIDEDSYDLVNEAVDKMISGEHAEVQYPWHHPDGHTMIVRCGGVINREYKKGIRIEGTHQDVSAVIHYDEEALKRAKQQEIELIKSKLRADAIMFISDNEPNAEKFVDFFGNKILEISKADQVIFRSIRGKRKVFNAEGIIDIPQEICSNCPFSKYDSEIYEKEDMVLMDRCEEGYDGVMTHKDCPAKSSVMQRIYCNHELIGLLSVHYLKKQHTFSADGIEILKTVATYMGLLLDRIEAKKKLQELQKEKERNLIEPFVENFASAYSIDLINDTFEILQMNHEFKDMFVMNGSKDDMRKFVKEHIIDEDQKLMYSILEEEYVPRRLKNENYFTFMIREKYGDDIRTMRVLIAKMEDEYHVALGFMDISEELRKEQENQQHLKDALSMAEAANKAKTTFLNNMSHDIRTPMNAIVGYTNLATKHIDRKEQVLSYLSKIEQSSDHLLSLINDVLEMSRIESGNINMLSMEESISEIIASIKDMSEADIKKKDLKFIVESENIRNDKVIVDKLRLNQVLINVISNAVKYTPNGGTIVFSVKESESAENDYSVYTFTVEDSGMGMSKDFIDKIFDPFTRMKNTTVSGIQGTGLGMAITKNIVDLMGGSIEVESELSKGTKVTIVFGFKIPRDTVEEKSNPISYEETDDRYAGKKLLLVEDNELNRDIANEMLLEYGFIVSVANDGDEAVEMVKSARKGDYDIILMDVQMPTIDGYEATRRIRALNTEVSKIPIIAMTANAFEEDRRMAIESGMDEHLAKPISAKKFVQVIDRFIK